MEMSINNDEVDIPPLTQLYLYLSDGCNLKCRHCWITPHFSKTASSSMNNINIHHLIRTVREAKSLGLRSAKLTGGEPLLHPQFLSIVDALSAENLDISMETNGTLITNDLAMYLKHKTNLRFISISLDGANSNTHDNFRGVKGSFDSALNGMKSFVNAGFKNVQVIMSIHRGNIGEIEELIELVSRVGIDSIKFNLVNSSGRGTQMHQRNETLSLDETISLIHKIRNYFQERTSLRLTVLTPPAISSVKELLDIRNSGTACGVYNILGVLASGDMALCGIGQTVPELIFGNIETDSIAQVWQMSPPLQNMRKQLSNYKSYPGICGNCIHSRGCLTQCVAQNYLDNGTLVSPSYLCNELYKRGMFPQTRCRQTSHHGDLNQ